MASYAFFVPMLPGKLETWKKYMREMADKGKEMKASHKRAGLKVHRAWHQHTPQGDFTVVYMEAKDPAKVFEQFAKSTEPYDVWFRDKILIECHGMDMKAPPPPMNQIMFDYKG